eukprot:COSAG06_NODE_724_length_12795_cov_16.058129_8_plen_51_part_00
MELEGGWVGGETTRTSSIATCGCRGSSFLGSTFSDMGNRTSKPPYESVLT